MRDLFRLKLIKASRHFYAKNCLRFCKKVFKLKSRMRDLFRLKLIKASRHFYAKNLKVKRGFPIDFIKILYSFLY